VAARREHLRSLVAARRASRRYAVVLLLTLVAFVFAALAPSADWAVSVLVLLETGTLIAALWTSRAGPIGFRAPLLVIGASAAAVQLLVGGSTLTGLVGLLSGVIVACTIGVIARGVVGEHEVNLQSILGAVSVYLLVGLFFNFLYGAVAELGSGPFFAQGTDGTPADRFYFSVITQTTVGYGDFTAAGELGRTLAMVEALVGQLYLVTVIGVLVGRLRDRPRRPASP
jgi:hypothetical protein